MKLRTPFTFLVNTVKDIDQMHDFSYELPNETKDKFWEKECTLHPAKSTCKFYEV